ncbi:MAG: bifunctional molybdenum cofactor biosynthesis protein MoaC/MoaB [Propionibacteriaceae bacterium]|jgi:cyclic pyranopterin phosphate synthase|nr:bifunctional molybdenum cofactor biosynthesis protein MoaC/MoaB [Propionibacteriaceae bacterium]
MSGLTHLDSEGQARMVDVSGKQDTVRRAHAYAFVACREDTTALLRQGALPKGDALAVARIAGIIAAKKTPDLVPLCHPIALDSVSVTVEVTSKGVKITADVSCCGHTGVEMEALTAATVAALAVIDMVKGVDRSAHIAKAQITAKSGGHSGEWHSIDEGSDLPCARPLAQTPFHHPVGEGKDVASTGRAAVITISDRSFAGTREDLSGPALVCGLENLGLDVSARVVVPDEVGAIRQAMNSATGSHDLVITTGGTGLGPRDRTFEAVAPLLDSPIPGIDQALRAGSRTPYAALSRCLSGLVERCLVICLPGSLSAVIESLDVLHRILAHALAQIAGVDHHAPSSFKDFAANSDMSIADSGDTETDSEATL